MLKWSGLPWQGLLVAAGGLRNSPNHSARSQEPTCLENQLLQKYHCHFTPAKTFSHFPRFGRLHLVSVCGTPWWSVAPSAEKTTRALWQWVMNRLTARPYSPYSSISWCFLQSSSFSFTLIHFFFFFPFSFSCLTGRGCLSVARACMQGGSVKSPCQKLMKCVQGN